jgi:hypothetical protein
MTRHSLAQCQNQHIPVNVLFVTCVTNYKGMRPRVKPFNPMKEPSFCDKDAPHLPFFAPV